MTRQAVALAALLVGCGDDDPIVVFAAASLSDAASVAAERVERGTGRRVVVSVGSTALLARQIERGAPADVFLAADPEWLDRLVERGHAREPRALATGRLVVIGPRGEPPVASARAAVGGERLAMGDPSHVPAGTRAHRTLDRLGLWDDVERRVVYHADVRAVVAAVETGAARRGVVYASDARASSRVTVVHRFESGGESIAFAGALVGEADGQRVLDALTDEEGRAGLARLGFDPPQ